MLLPRVAVLTTFALTSPAFADPGAIVAALPDEAAECRYFTQLCDEARTARGAAVEAEQKNKAAGGRQARSYAARREALVKSRGWSEEARKADAAYDRALTAQQSAGSVSRAAHLRWVKAHNEAVEAAKVLAAKHAQVPACLTACQDEVGRSD